MRRVRTSKALAARSAELAFAVPQVIAGRMMQMNPAEFRLMGAEKVAAAAESWNAMAMQSFFEGQKLAYSAMMSFWFPWLRRPGSKQFGRAALGIAGAGLAPIHRRARANARRLRRKR